MDNDPGLLSANGERDVEGHRTCSSIVSIMTQHGRHHKETCADRQTGRCIDRWRDGQQDIRHTGLLSYTSVTFRPTCADSASLLQMSLVQYIKFTQDCNIVDNRSTCTAADLDTIFISTNFEEEAGTQVGCAACGVGAPPRGASAAQRAFLSTVSGACVAGHHSRISPCFPNTIRCRWCCAV
jgi:hypothetical protein